MGFQWNKIDDFLASIALVGLIGITVANVTFRYIFNAPIPWGEEVSLGLYVWFVFVGTGSAMKRDGHIGIDYFVEKMPSRLKKFMVGFRTIIIYFVLLYVFIYLGYELTAQAGDKVTPTLGISYQWIDVSVVVGGILTLYHFTKNKKTHKRGEV